MSKEYLDVSNEAMVFRNEDNARIMGSFGVDAVAIAEWNLIGNRALDILAAVAMAAANIQAVPPFIRSTFYQGAWQLRKSQETTSEQG